VITDVVMNITNKLISGISTAIWRVVGNDNHGTIRNGNCTALNSHSKVKIGLFRDVQSSKEPR